MSTNTRHMTFRERGELALARRLRDKYPPPEPVRAPITAACPDSREGFSSVRTFWPEGVFLTFLNAKVPKGMPVTLYDDLSDPDVVRPASPARALRTLNSRG